jgi:dienelactone hydrolase
MFTSNDDNNQKRRGAAASKPEAGATCQKNQAKTQQINRWSHKIRMLWRALVKHCSRRCFFSTAAKMLKQTTQQQQQQKVHQKEVTIKLSGGGGGSGGSGGLSICGDLWIPATATAEAEAEAKQTSSKGLVMFAHGSGSSRYSTRNRFVAQALNRRGLATYLFDLLTPLEDETYANRFDIPLLTRRFTDVCTQLSKQLPPGYRIGAFGASTGAAVAIDAAAELGPARIACVVSRGGRPDLAAHLDKLRAPVLLLVGAADEAPVLQLNEKARDALLLTEPQLKVIPGATHLFTEPGALESVGVAAGAFFCKILLYNAAVDDVDDVTSH